METEERLSACTYSMHVLLVWVRAKLASPGGSVVNNLPAKQEMQVETLGWEHLLEKEMANHSNILLWEIALTEKTW